MRNHPPEIWFSFYYWLAPFWTTHSSNFHVYETFLLICSSDNEPPVITGAPDFITLPTDHGLPFANVTWTEPSTTDNSGLQIKLVSSHSPGTLFHIGTSSVTYNATDSSGNMANHTFIITVQGILYACHDYNPYTLYTYIPTTPESWEMNITHFQIYALYSVCSLIWSFQKNKRHTKTPHLPTHKCTPLPTYTPTQTEIPYLLHMLIYPSPYIPHTYQPIPMLKS